MDVNEHERLSNITLKTQIKLNVQLFYISVTVKSSKDEHNSFPKKNMKWSLACSIFIIYIPLIFK
jgi:hypothetical protein